MNHHIQQALKAHKLFKLDEDYIVSDGEGVIVDEFTGRLMIGRRYSDGLHQAIEAKEGVEVRSENKTYATVTFQNYFRLYSKLSGMTGTAKTEEAEFRTIYSLDVVEIPTNRPIKRVDLPDMVYATQEGKKRAIIEEIMRRHESGQPILVGTSSVDKSEEISRLLRKNGIKHNILNAKNHEREAEIVAQAGRLNAVTISTNMAGRGTDIMLGGNAEYLAKAALRHDGLSEELITEATGFAETDDNDIISARELYKEYYEKFKAEIAPEAEAVRNAGGLSIIGTERHDSRRIDNQLRGRAGRQGDPGNTQFFISLEDDLMRLFGGNRIQGIMDTLKLDENVPVDAKMLSGSIESAQKKVEGRNFETRKSVLRFDDVMNQQREIIYGQRGKVLEGEDISEYIANMRKESVEKTVDIYLANDESKNDWNLDGLRDYYLGWLLTDGDLRFTKEEFEKITKITVKKPSAFKTDGLHCSISRFYRQAHIFPR